VDVQLQHTDHVSSSRQQRRIHKDEQAGLIRQCRVQPLHEFEHESNSKYHSSKETRLQHAPRNLLRSDTRSRNSHEGPRPRVSCLRRLRPERVLVCAVTLELALLGGVELVVTLFLGRLGLGVAADEAQEDVVGNGAEEQCRMGGRGRESEEGEGQMGKSIAEVAKGSGCQSRV
jgi:hypothetical protein